MIKRNFDLESQIRDSQQYKLEIQYEHFSDEIKTKLSIKISFIKFDKEIIELTLIEPLKFDCFDDFGTNHVENLKVFESDDNIIFCFDPYDEQIDEIQEDDNFILKAKSYKINIKNI